MKNSRRLCVVVVIFAILAFSGTPAKADPMTESWHRRDRWASHKMFVWYTEAALNWKLDEGEKAILSRQMGQALPPSERRIEGKLTILRTPDLAYVEHDQQRATMRDYIGRFTYWLGRDYSVVVNTVGTSARPMSGAVVFPGGGDALHTGVPSIVPSPDEVTRWLHPSFFAGVAPDRAQAPLRWLVGRAPMAWSVAERRPPFVVLKLSGAPGVSGELWADEQKQFAPTYFHAQTGAVDIAMRVTRWHTMEGWQIPAEVDLQVQQGSTWALETRLILKQVSVSPPSLSVRLPLGTSVTDLRMVPFENLLSEGPNAQGEVYLYPWNGAIPPIATLPTVGVRTGQAVRMIGASPEPQPKLSISDFLRWFAPPTLLTLIGALWYWRLRRRGECNWYVR